MSARRVGGALHLIEDEAVDAGAVLGYASFAVLPRMSVQLNYFLTIRCASGLLPDCLAELEEGRLAPLAQDPEAGAYFRWPDSASFDRLCARGHALISLRQLWGILVGRHDDFRADRVELLGEGAVSATLADEERHG